MFKGDTDDKLLYVRLYRARVELKQDLSDVDRAFGQHLFQDRLGALTI